MWQGEGSSNLSNGVHGAVLGAAQLSLAAQRSFKATGLGHWSTLVHPEDALDRSCMLGVWLLFATQEGAW